jgi:hypothetical protein
VVFVHEALENRNIDLKVMKSIRCKGILERLQVNGLWRDCDEYITTTEEDMNVDDDSCGVISYDDILKSIGYPDDMLKFQSIISKYQNDQSSLESTAEAEASDTLVYTIKMA